MDLHKTLFPFYITKKMSHVTVTSTKIALRWQRYPGPRCATIVHTSVFQPGFREWLPGVPPKGIEIAWDEISNHSSMRCSNIDTWIIT